MHKKSVYISAGLHAALMIMATVSWPWLKRDFVVPQPMMVEMVEIAELTQTDKPRPTPAPKQKEEPKEEEPAPPPKPKVAENKEQAPAPPKKEEEKKVDDKKDKEVKAEPKPEKKAEPKPKPEKKKEEKKKEDVKESTKDFSSVLKNLTDSDETAPSLPTTSAPNLNADAQLMEGANAPVGDKMTMREEDALRAQLEKCWNVPYGAKDAGDIIVSIFMVINPDRTLREARVVDTSRYNSDTFYRAMADSAMRAVRNPLCSPFELPADKYNVWKTTTVTFNPSQMF